MTVEKQKVIDRVIKRLEGFYLDEFSQSYKQDYLKALDGHLTAYVGNEQLTLIQEAVNSFPIQLLTARQFIDLIEVKKNKATTIQKGNRDDGKDWARVIMARVNAGDRLTNICVKWAREVLEKTGEIEKARA